MRTRRLSAIAAALGMAACALGTVASARAQGTTLDRFSPAETVRDGFYVSRPNDLGHLRFGFDVVADYANDPLVLELDPGNLRTESTRVVSDQLAGHAGLWFAAFDRLVLFAGLDANFIMRGESFRDPASGATLQLADGAGLGDARAGLRVRLFGADDAVFALALAATATFPTAEAADRDQHFAGEDSFTVLPELLAEVRAGLFRATVNGGVAVREDQALGNVPLEDELRFALGLGVAIIPERFDLLAEVFGSTALADFADREVTPIEFLAGVKLWIAEACAFGLAGGGGVTRGIGSPDLRTVASFGCELPSRSPDAPERPADADRDGVLDVVDRCPTSAEDRDGREDRDGCPDPDDDRDGLPDPRDRCPLQPEDTDGFDDEDGCPDVDNDHDRIADTEDECTGEAEDDDSYEDEDGCPEPDNDVDGILDADDACPTAPGRVQERGCPKAVRIEAGRIVILDRVEFATGKAIILKASEPLLEEVRATIAVNRRLTRIRIEGHTDDRGAHQANLQLSRRRARAVARFLVEHGIDDQRLEAYGCGENLPLETNHSAKGRKANRRVEFHIIEPTPPTAPRSTEGCEAEDL